MSSSSSITFPIDDWVVDEHESLNCSICLDILYQPVNLSTCSHTFCLHCLQKLVQDPNSSPACPECKTALSSSIRSILSTPDCINGWWNEQLRKLKVACPHCKATEAWTGTLGIDRANAIAHRGECGYVPVPCSLGCGQSIARSSLTVHEKDECTKRSVQCDRCNQHFPVDAISAHLINDKECGNCHLCKLGCGQLLLDTLAAAHVKEACTHRPVLCPICNASVQHHLLDHHLQTNLVQHITQLAKDNASLKQQLSLASSTVAQQDMKVSKMQSEISCLRTQLSEVSDVLFTERLYVPGQWVDVLDTKKQWLCAQVASVMGRVVKVSYSGWDAKWDEWLSMESTRIRQLGSKTSQKQVNERGKLSPYVPFVLPK